MLRGGGDRAATDFSFAKRIVAMQAERAADEMRLDDDGERQNREAD
ncbi:hypothetical protein [Methylopila sp. M107]|nr:hypothetical protein [Methylopila sp. M107]